MKSIDHVLFDKKMTYKERLLEDLPRMGVVVGFLVILVVIINIIYGWIYLLLWILWALYDNYRSSVFYISYVSLDSDSVCINYEKYDNKYSLKYIPIKDIKFVMKSIWYDPFGYIYLDVFVGTEKILRQYTKAKWRIDTFTHIINSTLVKSKSKH